MRMERLDLYPPPKSKREVLSVAVNECHKCNGLGKLYEMEGKTLIQKPCDDCLKNIPLSAPILASWDDIRQQKRSARVLETETELEVLRIFERAGHIKINTFMVLDGETV